MIDFGKTINASDLTEWIMETDPDWCVGAIRCIVDHIDEMPSAQPEIIRCVDCENYQTEWETTFNGRHYCAVMDSIMPCDGFCSYAERRTDG